MSGAWGSRVSLAQRLAAQPSPPPPPPRVRQPDGSISAPVPLSLSDNLTVVLSLLLLSSDLSQIALLPASASASDRAIDGFHAPSELLLQGETLTDAASLLHARLTGRPADSSSTRVASVEHYPTLRQQWLRYTCVVVADVAAEAQLVEAASWFPLTAVLDGGVKLASAGDLARVLQSITEAQSQRAQRNIPLSLGIAANTQTLPASPSVGHLAVSLLFTSGCRILLSSSTPHSLPSTHCDKGETLTFTAHRFTRALLGLPHARPSVLALHHQAHGSQYGVHVVCHVAVDATSVVEREADESCSELVEGGGDTERTLRSYTRLRWFTQGEVEERRREDAMDTLAYECCQLAFSRMQATDTAGAQLGVPALHVEAADSNQQQPALPQAA